IALQLVLPAMGISMDNSTNLLLGVGITTVGWLLVTFLTPPDQAEVLREFYRKLQPAGPGWNRVVREAYEAGVDLPVHSDKGRLPLQILAMLLGTVAIYSALFATGKFIYGETLSAVAFTLASLASSMLLYSLWQRIK
ncbi:MAG: hypothetical protein AAF804_21750, partial [Bacteroidota bacterium]